jgi:hypothetical protein
MDYVYGDGRHFLNSINFLYSINVSTERYRHLPILSYHVDDPYLYYVVTKLLTASSTKIQAG